MGKENFKPGVIHLGKEILFGKGDVKMPGEKSSPTRGGYKGGMSKGKSTKYVGKKVGKGSYEAGKTGGGGISAPSGGGRVVSPAPGKGQGAAKPVQGGAGKVPPKKKP